MMIKGIMECQVRGWKGAHTAESDGVSGGESFVTFQDQRIRSDQECSLYLHEYQE